ncbi:hypothetical protein GGX14DRAFT_698326, partial [Mycena pura]
MWSGVATSADFDTRRRCHLRRPRARSFRTPGAAANLHHPAHGLISAVRCHRQPAPPRARSIVRAQDCFRRPALPSPASPACALVFDARRWRHPASPACARSFERSSIALHRPPVHAPLSMCRVVFQARLHSPRTLTGLFSPTLHRMGAHFRRPRRRPCAAAVVLHPTRVLAPGAAVTVRAPKIQVTLRRKLGSLEGLEYALSSVNPSEELCSLVRAINPDFVWRSESFVNVIEWLKRIQPFPDSTIQIWEDYRLLHSCDEDFYLPRAVDGAGRAIGDAHDYYILTHHPHLVRVFQAWFMFYDTGLSRSPTMVTSSIRQLRALLNMSWDELRFIFRPLHSCTGERLAKVHVLLDLVSRFETISGESYPWPTACLDVARGLLRLQKHNLVFFEHGWLESMHFAFGQLIRLSPPSLELLSGLRELLSLAGSRHINWESMHRYGECHSINIIVQWLKTFPEPPEEDIASWGLCLDASRTTEDGVTVPEFSDQALEDFW